MIRSKDKRGFDPAAVLRIAGVVKASLDAAMTAEERDAAAQRLMRDESSSLVYSTEEREQALEDFETLAAVDTLSALADEIQTMVDQRMAEAYKKALHVYYVMEEMSHDPAHADLLPHVEAVREAHQKQYGKPIPPK